MKEEDPLDDTTVADWTNREVISFYRRARNRNACRMGVRNRCTSTGTVYRPLSGGRPKYRASEKDEHDSMCEHGLVSFVMRVCIRHILKRGIRGFVASKSQSVRRVTSTERRGAYHRSRIDTKLGGVRLAMTTYETE